jgi:hypothetical protein
MGITITKSYTSKANSAGSSSSVGVAMSGSVNDEYVVKLKKALVFDEENDALCTPKNFYSEKSVSALGADIDKINFLAFTINENMELIMATAAGIDDFTFEIDENKCLILKTL